MPEFVSMAEIGDFRRVEHHPLKVLGSLLPAYDGQDHSDMTLQCQGLVQAGSVSAHLVSLRDVYLCFLPGRDGAIVTADGRVIEESCWFIAPEQREKLNDFHALRHQAVALDGPVFSAVDGGWWGWYHWLALSLGRLAAARPHLPRESRLALPGYREGHGNRFAASVWRDSLASLDLPVEVMPDGVYSVSDLQLLVTDEGPTPVTLLPEFHRTFLEIGRRAPAAERLRLLVLRRDNPRLSAEVVSMVHDTASEFGFKPVELEKLEFPNQVALFAQAEQVVGAHGAGLVNTVFAPPGCRILELNHQLDVTGGLRPHYCTLADGAGHLYRYLNGSRGDFTAERLREALSRMAAG